MLYWGRCFASRIPMLNICVLLTPPNLSNSKSPLERFLQQADRNKGGFVVRKLSVAVAAISILFILVSHSNITARDLVRPETHVWRYWSPEMYAGHLSEIDPGLVEMYSSAAIDTYTLVYYDFEDMNWQGWTQVDNTAQHGEFFHADDFAGLDGGDFGRLVPIEGTKSLWCGARPGTDEYMCGWYNAPGYGNNWDQIFRTWDFPVTGGVVNFSYHGVFDSESGYDFTYVEYSRSREDWVELDAWSGIVDTVVTHEIFLTRVITKLRFRFVSDAKWSDQDGGGNTDGACVIDQISISDNTGLLDYEDFEDWDIGANTNLEGWWSGILENPYGIYSGLWTGLVDRDPCNSNFGTQIVFFVGSPNPSEDYPGLYDTPLCYNFLEGPCQDEMVVSPAIDLTKYSTGNDEVQDVDIPTNDLSDLAGTLLRFTMYGDRLRTNNVWPYWYVRSIDETGCPGQWEQINQYFMSGPFFEEGIYYFIADDMAHLIDFDHDRIQVALEVRDLCEYYYIGTGDCENHTPAPWFDNVRVQRYKIVGPQWVYSDYDLFQDNFPEDEYDVESFVRADAADDKAGGMDPYFIPGDSIVVTCDSPLGPACSECILA